jgi:hypothetical protein
VLALLSSNVRVNDRRLAEALKADTLASQACRQQATPEPQPVTFHVLLVRARSAGA